MYIETNPFALTLMVLHPILEVCMSLQLERGQAALHQPVWHQHPR